MVDSERRTGRKQRVRKVRFPSESISRQDYQTGTDTSTPCTFPLYHNSQSLWVYSRLKGSRTTQHTSAHALTRSVIRIRAQARTNARVSAGDLYFRYASRLEKREDDEGQRRTEVDRPLCSTFSRQFSAREGREDGVANGENSRNRFDGPQLVSLNPDCNLLFLLLFLFVSTPSSLSVSHLCARTSATKKPW